MPDRRKHRGPHPEDARLFSPELWPKLREALGDLCWLLDRGYAEKSSLKLVGDRYELVARQRTAIARCASSKKQVASRRRRQVGAERLCGQPLLIDGYNVLTTIESALAGGIILPGRDGTYRDMASMHGSYRKVAETYPALELLGQALDALRVSAAVWYLDRPVSNSGRLKGVIGEVAAAHGWFWNVELVRDPDQVLSKADRVVATADGVILDCCGAWFNLACETVRRYLPHARVIPLVPIPLGRSASGPRTAGGTSSRA